MKKANRKKGILCCILFLLIVCGYLGLASNYFGLEESRKETSKQETIHNNEEKDYVEPYVDENPITIGFYRNQNGTRNLISSYNSPLTLYQDIVSLEVYFTNEVTLIGNQLDLWNQYYQNYPDIENYKIGYHISFQASDLEVNQTILNPSDVNSFFDYIQIYLYDDIHQDSEWYDHISQEEVTEETIFTSIKLTASTKIDEINSPIKLSVFIYDSNDLDESGNYRGNNSYEIEINRES